MTEATTKHWPSWYICQVQAKNKMCMIVPLLLPSLSFLLVFGEAVCSLFQSEVMHGIEEKFIPKKGEARWQRGLHEARWEAFEEASYTLLFGYLRHAVQQASITPHLHGKHRRWSLNTPNMFLRKRETRCRRAYLSKVKSGCLKASHLQSLLEEVKRVCDCFADNSCSTAADQAPQISLKGDVKKVTRLPTVT